MTSAVRRISSFDAGRAPAARTCASSPRALHPSTSMPIARPSVTTRAPMVPIPSTPSVLPRSWVSSSRGHRPARISASRSVILRPTASISVSACSATAKALMPGVLQTVTPRMPAALRSMLSVPVPHTETSLSAGQAVNTVSLNRACARMLMAIFAAPIRRISSRSSSAPRSENTRTSPSFLARSCASVPAKTEGKSSGTTITPRSRRATAPRRLPRQTPSDARDRAASARATTASAGCRAGWT